jgi:hypothetical protein
VPCELLGVGVGGVLAGARLLVVLLVHLGHRILLVGGSIKPLVPRRSL